MNTKSKRSLVLICVAVVLPAWLASVQAENNTSGLNVTLNSNGTTPSSIVIPTGKLSPLSVLPRFNRTRTNHSTTAIHSKVKMSSFGVKLHNTTSGNSSAVNVTELNERLADLAAKHNVTHQKLSHRFNSSRLINRLTSKPLSSNLNSSADDGQSSTNKSQPIEPSVSRVNVTSLNLRNATTRGDRINKTILRAERSILDQLTNATEEVTSVFQNLPNLLSSARSNVTSWAMDLLGRGNSSSNVTATTTRFTREVNATESSRTNSTEVESDSVKIERTRRQAEGNVVDARMASSYMVNRTPAPAYSPYNTPPAYEPAVYGMAPPAPGYEQAPAAPVYSYPSAPVYGQPGSSYTTPPSYTAPAYGQTPAAAAYPQAYPQASESYYTAPPPTYSTSQSYPAQYVTPAAPSAPVSYPAQPYGSMPVRPAATPSPWYY